MKKIDIITIFVFALIGISVTQSCKKEKEEDPDPQSQEFIANNNTFTGFMSWSLDATKQGPDPALGGAAHGGNDSSVVRNVYFKNGQNPVNGKYPIGTLIVKHSANPAGSVNERTAMVKRGNNFNPTKGDWEFFMLKADGTIATDTTGAPMRGANLMNGMCGGCHAGAASKDYIFSK